jgi:diguanylate cyclase (GGDEF)-like protein/PAS domain S-box-containing protein
MGSPGGRAKSLAVAVVALLGTTALALTVVASGDERIPLTLLLAGPIAAALFCSRRDAAVVSGWVILLGLPVAVRLDDRPAIFARYVVLVAVCVLCAFYAQRRWQAERQAAQLAVSEQRYRSIVETASEGIVLVDPAGAVTFANERCAQIFGRPSAQIVGTSLRDASGHPGSGEALEDYLAGIAAGHPVRYEFAFDRGAGERSWVLVSGSPLYDANGAFMGAIALLTDITERKRWETDLEQMALWDALTGLANRRLLLDRMTHALIRRDRGGTVAVLFCDLDGFKRVNDTLGHAGGDALLCEVAQRFRAAVRPEDTLGRLGGDEFVVLCEGIPDADTAIDVGLRLQSACAEPITLEGRGIARIAVSVGIALAEQRPAAGGDPTEVGQRLLRDADVALYRAKEQGGHRCVLFDPSDTEAGDHRLHTPSDLEAALGRSELAVLYQPVVALRGGDAGIGAMVGAVAMVRWGNPGVLAPLEQWVLRRALEDAAHLGDKVDLRIPLHLPGHQLDDLESLEFVTEALAESGFPAARLVIEIGENALANAGAAAGLTGLRALGVRVALTGFGIGHAPLTMVATGIDEVKLHPDLVADLGVPRVDARVAGILRLSSALSLSVAAEGVSSAAQVATLVRLGCRIGQGPYLGEPVAAVELDGSPGPPPRDPEPLDPAR